MTLGSALGFSDDAVDSVKEYLLEGSENAVAQKRLDTISSMNRKTEILMAKSLKRQYEGLFTETYAQEVSNTMIDYWKKRRELKRNKELKVSGTLKQEIDKNEEEQKKDVNNILTRSDVAAIKTAYIKQCRLLDENTTVSYEAIDNMIVYAANKTLQKLQNAVLKLEKKMLEIKLAGGIKKYEDLQQQRRRDKIREQMAEIPLQIEDKLNEIKQMFDGAVGKYLGDTMDPLSKNFNVDTVVDALKALIDPALQVANSLKDLNLNIPIFGDLTKLFQLLQSNQPGTGQLTMDEIEERLGKMYPELPSNFKAIVQGIKEDFFDVCSQIPMLMINIILTMIKKIVENLGLDKVYPFKYLADLIKFAASIPTIAWSGTKYLEASMEGVVCKIIKESLAMSLPTPLTSADISALIPTEDQLADDLVQFKDLSATPLSYYDVNASMYASLSAREERNEASNDKNGGDLDTTHYSMTDLARILKSYKKIYNGTRTPYDIINVYSVSTEKTVDSKTKETVERVSVSVSSIERTPPSPEDYRTKLQQVFAQQDPKFMLYCSVEDLVGSDYQIFYDFIKSKEPNDYCVVMYPLTNWRVNIINV